MKIGFKDGATAITGSWTDSTVVESGGVKTATFNEFKISNVVDSTGMAVAHGSSTVKLEVTVYSSDDAAATATVVG